MFKMISWSQYLGVAALLLVVYYAYVAVVYYRAELTALVTGKGKIVTRTVGQAVMPSLLPENGPLIPKAAIVMPIAAEQHRKPEETEGEEGEDGEVTAAHPNRVAVESSIEETEEYSHDEEEIASESYNEKINSSTAAEITTTEVAAEDAETENEEVAIDYTVGVAQLNHFLERAAAGEMTQQQIEREVPALENTEVLMAFFQKSTKAAQRLTAKVYAQVEEPVAN
ncbi:hypothetical protein [Hymenobacter sp. YC55]|uniref:hypothetical protein n=1 Tax=Hymenobacter sp. YC55 TaxID=3034019 RepID=UPI0023F637C9|nr:hypothetical protein [Hymenobacter sp. YC55]MDF7815109.1 hypothetical protein [Hymenobacter sp. YC55]